MLQELESWFASGLKFVEDDILPVAVLALDIVPGVPAIIPTIIGKMPELISTAEKMFPGDGKGTIKQQYFMQTAQMVAADVAGLSTGAQAATWTNEIQPKIDPVLTLIMATINKYKPGTVDMTVDNNAIGAGIPGGGAAG